MTDESVDTPVLVFCSSGRYAVELSVSLYSAIRTARLDESLRVFIFDAGIGEDQRARLVRAARAASPSVGIEWVEPDMSLVAGLKVDRHLAPAAYLRLLMPELLPSEISKAIYLDSDMLVLADVGLLWRTEMNGHPLLAVHSPAIPFLSSPGGVRMYEALGLPASAPYLRSSTLVLDLDRWRRDNIADRVFEYLKEYRDHVDFHDQDGMNAVLAGDFVPLDPRWSWSEGPLNDETWAWATRHMADPPEWDGRDPLPFIQHFPGAAKPRRLACSDPAKVAWRRALEATAWSDPVA